MIKREDMKEGILIKGYSNGDCLEDKEYLVKQLNDEFYIECKDFGNHYLNSHLNDERTHYLDFDLVS